MRHGSLFSGIGGFDLAAEWMGWTNVFHCEINEFGRKVLHHYWPKAIQYSDITKTDFSTHANTIDILTGGFPCQPYSQAGKRKGKEDERHLWPEMLRAIREIQPSWIVGENVRGLTNWNGGLVFDEVQADLETESYEVLPFLLPACSVGAPHRRDRLWIIAHSSDNRQNIRQKDVYGCEGENIKSEQGGYNEVRSKSIRLSRVSSNTNISGQQECRPQWFTPIQFAQDNRFASEPGIRRGVDGIPYRVDRLKALGNAIVPQIAYEIFKAINSIEENKN